MKHCQSNRAKGKKPLQNLFSFETITLIPGKPKHSMLDVTKLLGSFKHRQLIANISLLGLHLLYGPSMVSIESRITI